MKKKISKKKAKVGKVMSEYKAGKLHSGSKKGPIIKKPQQALAVALQSAKKTAYGEKRSGGKK